MNHKKQLIEKIEIFYIDVVEEFKESELKIAADSQFKSMFRKKDYDGNIQKLKLCKKQALTIDTADIDIPKNDKASIEVERRFERCLVIFNGLCDAYVQLQLALKKKAQKEPLKFSEYKEIFQKVQTARVSLNDALHELDVVYTDYAYEDGDEIYTYID